MDQKPEQCFNCGNPAIKGRGTVPLCSQCQTLAAESKRGVKYDGNKIKQDSRGPS